MLLVKTCVLCSVSSNHLQERAAAGALEVFVEFASSVIVEGGGGGEEEEVVGWRWPKVEPTQWS